MAASDINRARYAGSDFDTHLDDLRGRTQARFASYFNDLALSGLGAMLLDVMSFGLDALSFYLDRRATESYLATARTAGAVSRLSRSLGYKMRAATASAVDLTVALVTAQAFDVPVPKGFQFQGPEGLIFEVAETVTFATGAGPLNPQQIPCYEGETLTENFVADGTSNQSFDLRRVPDGKFLASGSAVVTVDGTPFAESEFFTFEATNQFELDVVSDPPTLSFGDGIAGNIPADGASISITYVATKGVNGQVKADTITSVVAPLVVASTTIELTINNVEGSVGGSAIESLDEAKANAPKVFKSRDVAVTREDYEALASTFSDPLFGRVAVAQALSTRSAAADLALAAQISIIDSAVTGASAPAALVNGTHAPALRTNVTAVETSTAEITTQLAAAKTSLSTIDGGLTTILAAMNDIKNDAQQVVDVDADDILTLESSGRSAVDAIAAPSGGGGSQLTNADKTAIKDFFLKIAAEANSIKTGASGITSTVNSSITTLGNLQTEEDNITAAGGYIPLIEDEVAAIETQTASMTTTIDTIDTLVIDNSTTVLGATTEIQNHIDRLLSSDCKANLVTVPILTRDANGFLASPSVGLVQVLQTFLEARKEVTHTVEVVSGSDALIPAVLTIHIGVQEGKSETAIKQLVENVIDGILRNMLFGEDLYRSHLDLRLQSLEGVGFVNVTIDGHLVSAATVTTKVVSGNLVVSDGEVITKGTVTVTTELVPATVGV